MKRCLILIVFAVLLGVPVQAQDLKAKIYETERAFEKMAGEKGVAPAFLHFLTPNATMFMPEPVNGHEFWKKQGSTEALNWDPMWIDVSSNGIFAYSVGNSIYRAKGKDDPNAHYGNYLTIWARQPDGEYRAVLDTGITHNKKPAGGKDWRSPAAASSKSDRNAAASDSSVGFYEMAAGYPAEKAYSAYLADDAVMLREGSEPFWGKKAIVKYLKEQKQKVSFAKRKSFLEAGDVAWVTQSYRLTDKSGNEVGRGNFVQIWKLNGGKWKIAVDAFLPLPAKK